MYEYILSYDHSECNSLGLKVYEYTNRFFLPFYEGQQLKYMYIPICFPEAFSKKMGSTLTEKNLLLEEQILFSKS